MTYKIIPLPEKIFKSVLDDLEKLRSLWKEQQRDVFSFDESRLLYVNEKITILNIQTLKALERIVK